MLFDLINIEIFDNSYANYFCVNPAEFKVIPCEKAQKSTYHCIKFPKFIVFNSSDMPSNPLEKVYKRHTKAAVSV